MPFQGPRSQVEASWQTKLRNGIPAIGTTVHVYNLRLDGRQAQTQVSDCGTGILACGAHEPKSQTKGYGLCSEFLIEAAVLVFVFPILDKVIQVGRQSITTGLVL